MAQAKCRECGADLIFTTTKLGKKIPLDWRPHYYEPDPNGELVFRVINEQAIAMKGRRVSSPTDKSVLAFKSHFSTCPAYEPKRKKQNYRSEIDARIKAARKKEQEQRAAAEEKRRRQAEKEAEEREWRERQMSLFRT